MVLCEQKGRIGGGGLIYLKGESSMTMSGLGYEIPQ